MAIKSARPRPPLAAAAGRRSVQSRASPSELTAETRYRLLLEIARRTGGTLDLNRILNHLLDSLAEHLDFDAAGIFVLRQSLVHAQVDSLGDVIAGVTWRGFSGRSHRTDPMLRDGQGIVGEVIRSGRPVVVDDVRLDPRYVEGRPGTRSEIAAPILRDGLVIGALNLESDRLAAFDSHSLEVLRFYAEASAIAVEKAMLHEQLLQARRTEEQVRIAQEVQKRLLPSSFPHVPGYDLGGLSIPCARVGGDYFDFITGPNDDLTLAVADVAGHGIPAALLLSALRALVRTQVRIGTSLSQLGGTLNRQMPESMAGAAFVTACIGTLAPEEGAFSYVNCGHTPPVLVRANGAVETLDSGGPLLGVLEDAYFQVGSVTIAPGDVLVLMTDGILEVTDRDGRWFDVQQLAALIAMFGALPAGEMARQIVQATREFTGAVDFEDDVTLVVVKRGTGLDCGKLC